MEGKYCSNCNNYVDMNSNFCTRCGGSEFYVYAETPAESADPEATTVLNQEQYQQIYNQQQGPQAQQTYQTYQTEQQPPKKKKTWLIVLIVVIILLVLGTIGMVAEKVFQNLGYGEPDSLAEDILNGAEEVEIEEEKVEYTTGTFDGTEYENEWANLRITIPEGYTEATEDEYATMETMLLECGIYVYSNESGILSVMFEPVEIANIEEEEAYLALIEKNFSQTEAEGSYEFPDSYDEITIANEEYVAAHYKVYGLLYQSCYVRIHDGRAITIMLFGKTIEENNELVKTFEEY